MEVERERRERSNESEQERRRRVGERALKEGKWKAGTNLRSSAFQNFLQRLLPLPLLGIIERALKTDLEYG